MIKKIFPVLIIALFAICIKTSAQSTPLATAGNQSELAWLEKWFSAWELMAKDVLLLPADPAPKMLFFDKENIYTTSDISSANGQLINGPALLGEKMQWKKEPHNGKLILPNGQEAPIGLMSFAGPAKNEKAGKFFVMAAPSFWKEEGVKSDELGLDNLLIGVFLHEFAHTRQMEGIGALVEQIEKENKFEKELNDDIVQDYFKKDSIYTNRYNAETNTFYEAVFAESTEATKKLTTEAIALLKKRQADYFTKDKTIFKQLDDIFLSMEGLGQYMAVAWLTHPKGGKMDHKTAVKGFRRGKKQWSQDEGLALFLLLTKLSNPDWATDMFGKDPVYVINLLEKAVEKK